MSTPTVTESDLHRLHHEQQLWDKRQRFLVYSRQLDPRRKLARMIEHAVRDHLADLGYIVTRTSHKCNYDLLVNGIRVEVKAARWYGQRYQANMRGNSTDVVVLVCVDGDDNFFFIIPFGEVQDRTVIKITRRDPRDYIGQWTPYYNAWDLLDDLVRAGRNPWQYPIPNI